MAEFGAVFSYRKSTLKPGYKPLLTFLCQFRPHQAAGHIWRLRSKLARKKRRKRLAARFTARVLYVHAVLNLAMKPAAPPVLCATRLLD